MEDLLPDLQAQQGPSFWITNNNEHKGIEKIIKNGVTTILAQPFYFQLLIKGLEGWRILTDHTSWLK